MRRPAVEVRAHPRGFSPYLIDFRQRREQRAWRKRAFFALLSFYQQSYSMAGSAVHGWPVHVYVKMAALLHSSRTENEHRAGEEGRDCLLLTCMAGRFVLFWFYRLSIYLSLQSNDDGGMMTRHGRCCVFASICFCIFAGFVGATYNLDGRSGRLVRCLYLTFFRSNRDQMHGVTMMILFAHSCIAVCHVSI